MADRQQRLILSIAQWHGSEGRGQRLRVVDEANDQMIFEGEITLLQLGSLLVGGEAVVEVQRAYPANLLHRHTGFRKLAEVEADERMVDPTAPRRKR
jgi:hypothetical protein